MTLQEQIHTVHDLRELEAQPENADKRFELIHGRIIEKVAPSVTHAYISNKFGRYLDEFIEEHDLGYTFGDSCSYVLDETHEFIPDASFVAKARHPNPPLPQRFHFAPDLAVEVVSPSNRPRQRLDRVETYIRFGTKLVWVVYPDERVVDVYRAAQDPENGLNVRKVEEDGTLDGEDVLPDFTLAVRRVFPKQA